MLLQHMPNVGQKQAAELAALLKRSAAAAVSAGQIYCRPFHKTTQ